MRSKKVLYNISSNLILQFVVIFYGFVVPKIVISNYGSNVNGLISSITQFLSYIALLDSGFTAVVKSQLYKPIAQKDNISINAVLKASDKFFKKIAYIFIIYIIILIFVYPLLVNNNFDYIFTISLIIILSISSFFEYYFGMVYRMFLQADQKSYVISIIQIITYILTIIITLLLAKTNVSIQILKLFTAFIFILRPLLQSLYVKKHYKINLKNAKKDYVIKNKWDGFAQHIASVIHNNTDITILTLFCNLIEVSVYSVYYLVIKGIKSLIQGFVHGIDASFGDMIARDENKKLNETFSVYESLYNCIATICFSCTLILIVPFVRVYTINITDANYIRNTFACLLVISEFIWAVRQPYNELVKAAGHFKETRIGAWIECISNILISVILVFKYGIIGVVIGTTVAMLIRTIEFIYHVDKYILKRKIIISIKKILLIIVETLIILVISNLIPLLENNNYFNLIINSIIICIISCIIVVGINYIFYTKELKGIFNIFSKLLRRKKKC